MNLGDRLRSLRNLVDISARELDRLAGKTPGHALLIESRPSADVLAGTLADYAQVFGVTLDWLALGKGKAPRHADVVAAVAASRKQLAERRAS